MRVVLIAALLATLGGGKPELILRVTPQMAFYGVPAKVETVVKFHPEVRTAVLASPFGDSRWEIDWNPQRQPNIRNLTIKLTEPGEHTFILAVFDQMGQELGRKEVVVKRIVPEEP